jgi:BolA protein
MTNIKECTDKNPFFLYYPTMREIIQQKLMAELHPTALEVVDESHKHAGHAGARPGGNTHFRIHMVSEAFSSLSHLERHRLVHDILKDELAHTIHALSLNLKSPYEY